jgi:hypothetical protein
MTVRAGPKQNAGVPKKSESRERGIDFPEEKTTARLDYRRFRRSSFLFVMAQVREGIATMSLFLEQATDVIGSITSSLEQDNEGIDRSQVIVFAYA